MVTRKEGLEQAPRQLRPVLALFRKLKAGSDLASFRAETRSAISGLEREGTIGVAESAQLIALRELVIEWRTTSGIVLSAAFSEWLQQYHSASNAAQRGILREILSLLPKGTLEEVHWWPIIAGEDEELCHSIVSGKLVRAADLVKLAKARPREFMQSRGLTVLLDMEVAVPRVVWESQAPAIVGIGEASVLEGGLATSYALDTAHDSSAWLIIFLAARPALRQRVIKELLREPAAMLRLIRVSAGYGVAGDGRRAKRDSAATFTLLADVVAACAEAIDEQRPTAVIAERSLYLLRQLIASDPENYADEVRSAVDSAVRVIIGSRLVDLLRRAQTSENPARDPALIRHVLPARGDEIASAVEVFLAELPEDTGDGHLNSHARHERYQAVRELVEDVLPMLDAPAGTDLTGALRTALFNAGTIPVGVVQERCAFDPVLHESGATDPTVGDFVRIHEQGWQLGHAPSVIVLRKARVELDATPAEREA